MRTSRAGLALFAASVAWALAACGGEPCADLSKALCDGGEAAYCAEVDAWLATRVIDPETKLPLEGEARAQMCRTISGSVDIFNAYRFKAKQKILGEPDFTLASSTPPENKADPTPKSEVKPAGPPSTPPAVPDTPDPPEDKIEDDKPGVGGGAVNMSD